MEHIRPRFAFDTRHGAAAVLALLAGSVALPAHAASDCRFFAVTIGGTTYTPGPSGDRKLTLPHDRVAGQIAKVRGKYVSFDVDLDTFTVTNYILTGVDAPNQITPERTRVFVSKVPDAILSGPMEMRIRDSSQNLVIEREGSIDMKIQSKDCDQGGVFQMEPEPSTTETNRLAPGFRYCYQASPIDRRFFTNDVVLGFDSPQLARVVAANDRAARWDVEDGGRVGLVLGEDAVEALEEAGPDAIGACPHQTP